MAEQHPLDHPKVASIREWVTGLFKTAPQSDKERIDRLLQDLSSAHWRMDKVQAELEFTSRNLAFTMRELPLDQTEEKK